MADFDIKKPELFPNAPKFFSDGAALNPQGGPIDRSPETSKFARPPVLPTFMQNQQAGAAPASENVAPANPEGAKNEVGEQTNYDWRFQAMYGGRF